MQACAELEINALLWAGEQMIYTTQTTDAASELKRQERMRELRERYPDSGKKYVPVKYICDYGHKHQTEKGRAYCHVNVPYMEKAHLVATTPWQHEGTTVMWSDLGEFQALFWGDMRSRILNRDRVCQYEQCGIFHDQPMCKWHHHTLEVHHIIPRRLGGTDHPANLVSLCHDHHRIQPAHHHDAGLVLCDADIPLTPFLPRRIRQSRPEIRETLTDFGF